MKLYDFINMLQNYQGWEADIEIRRLAEPVELSDVYMDAHNTNISTSVNG